MLASSNAFSLILGCGGYRYNKLTLCSGTVNVIINFDQHFDGINLEAIMDFLDYTCELFDRPIGEWNKVVNTLQIFHDKYRLINDELWSALHVWLPQHKRCGGYIRLIPNDELSKFIVQQEDLVLPETNKT